MKGLSFHKSGGDGLAFSMTADELEIKPRKFLAFSMNPFNELNLSKVVITNYRHPERISPKAATALNAPPADKLGMLDFSFQASLNFLNPKAAGAITRILFKDFTWKIVEDNNTIITVTAEEMVCSDKQKAKLKNVAIEDSELKQRLTCKSAVWNETKKKFEIKGRYLLTGLHRSESGEDLILDFRADGKLPAVFLTDRTEPSTGNRASTPEFRPNPEGF